jgi:hypothetical protein
MKGGYLHSMQKILSFIDREIVKVRIRTLGYLEENKYVIIFISLAALCAYGFELFNFNLTIDEEVAANLSGPNLAWISQGRWGMYLLNKFFLPFTVIPFVPLFLALIFHLGAILIILTGLEINGKFEKIIIGSIGIAYPGIAYAYTFSTLNYGIGIGLFCVALSLYFFIKTSGLRRLIAVIPAAFAISIYQGLLPALFAVYLLYIIKVWLLPDTKKVKTLLQVFSICVMAILLYYIVQKFVVAISRVPATGYVDQYFDFGYLKSNSKYILSRLGSFLFMVYTGNKAVYGQEVQILGVFMLVLSFGIFITTWKSKVNFPNKVLILIFSVFFLLLPFASGLFTSGYLAMRFLVCLPITMSGWVILGMNNNSRIYKSVVAILAAACLLQFAISTNHLFASSSLALERDRIIGSQLIERIENQEGVSKKSIKYLEMIGYLNNPSTELIPRSETFGASFFDWDQGNVWRVLMFLQTLGYNDLEALPLGQRAQMVETAIAMPIWPDRGSVKVVGDIVLVKFGPYSDIQKISICEVTESSSQLQDLGFCLK